MQIVKTKRNLVVAGVVLSLIFPVKSLQAQYTGAKIRVIVESGNIRLKPSLDSTVIKSVPIGSELMVQAKKAEWFLVKLPPDQNGFEITGYVHESVVELTKRGVEQTPAAKREAPVRTREPEPQWEPQPRTTTRAYGRAPGIIPGLALKFGWQSSPDPGEFSNAWLAAVSFDFALGNNLGLGLEIQPAVRNYSEIGLNEIPIMGFANLKAGVNLGELLPLLRPLNLFGGGGIGVQAKYTAVDVGEETITNFQTNMAYHILAGLEFNLGGLRLLGEYQLTQVSDPAVDPNFWAHYLLFGIKF
jgi:hypothetical protein